MPQLPDFSKEIANSEKFLAANPEKKKTCCFCFSLFCTKIKTAILLKPIIFYSPYWKKFPTLGSVYVCKIPFRLSHRTAASRKILIPVPKPFFGK